MGIKMNDFKNQKEIWEYLLCGGKVIRNGSNSSMASLLDGMVINCDGIKANYSFAQPYEWQKYVEPKKKIKVTLKRYTMKRDGEIWQSNWTTNSFEQEFNNYRGSELLKTESKEIEIEENDHGRF